MSATAPMKTDLIKKWAKENGIEPEAAQIETPAAVEAYYDASKKEFVMRNKSGRWLSHPARQFAMILEVSGIAENHCRAEGIMADVIDTRDVHYTGSLAGHPAGFYAANGVRMLVTEGPRILTPQAGEWPTIRRLIDGLLGSDPDYGALQVASFLYWMRSRFESVQRGQWRPGQILALAGPIGCGKSLLQRIITECLGGRAALPFRYLTGATAFNRDLFGAEHLVVDDEQASTDFRSRLNMAAHLKALAVGRDYSCHGKGRDAVTLRPLWSCSLSLNDEGECLLVLPPLRADIADKIHILKCSSPAAPFPTETPEAMAAYWSQLVAELPAFLHHCCQTAPPADRPDARFGCKAFHHPTLVAALENQAPEVVLLELIDLELWRDATVKTWEGTARELEAALLDRDSKVREQTRRLLAWPTACGTYLGRLAKHPAPRVENDRDREKRGWIIHKV